jgi:hypothetical protein
VADRVDACVEADQAPAANPALQLSGGSTEGEELVSADDAVLFVRELRNLPPRNARSHFSVVIAGFWLLVIHDPTVSRNPAPMARRM